MGSLSQITVFAVALVFFWNVSVIKCAPTRTDDDAGPSQPYHHLTMSSTGLGLDDDAFLGNVNYWARKNEDEDENASKHDEFMLPTIYQLRKHLANHNPAVAAGDCDPDRNGGLLCAQGSEYASSSASATAGEEGGGGDNAIRSNGGDSGEEGESISREYESSNPSLARPSYNLRRNYVYPVQKQYGGPNGESEYYRTAAKRSPMCLRKCMAQGQLHPAQCHSLC